MNDNIIKIIARHSGHKEKTIKPEQNLFNDLGFDSLDHIEMVMYLEAEYSIEISDEISDAWKTVQDVIDTIKGTMH